jgi:uncharacterized cupredoxin-like copper-binding protein
MRTLASILIATAFLAAACGGGASQTNSGGATLTATLKDNTIQLDQPSAPSGTVTFKVVNVGTVMHSLILLKTDVPHDKLALDPKDASRVDPVGLIRETGQIGIGQTKEFSAKLAAGNYVLVCNEPAHYQIGMHLGFTVK